MIITTGLSRACRKQSGLTLLETMFALALGIVILLTVTLYYPVVRNNSRMATTMRLVGVISDSVRTYAQSPVYVPGRINLATLRNAGLMTGSEIVSPWPGGTISVFTNGNYMSIQFDKVPAASSDDSSSTKASGVCLSLAMQLSNALPLPSPGTAILGGVTYTFSNPTGGVHVEWGNSTNPSTANSQGAAVCKIDDSDSTPVGTVSVLMDLT